MTIKHIALSFGYVEDNALGWVFFSKEPGFKTPIEALEDLALGLLRAYDENLFYEKTLGDCCKETQAVMPGAKLCAKCGHRFGPEELWDVEQFEYWLRGLVRGTCDSLGMTFDDNLGWDPWAGPPLGHPLEEILLVSQPAERFLVKALNPETVPDRCRLALIQWWEDSLRGWPDRDREAFIAECNEQKFNW